MEMTRINQHAHALRRAHGDRAEAEAAHQMRQAEERGSDTEAEDWRAIRNTIRTLRGPNQT